jgi:hypothetical protein
MPYFHNESVNLLFIHIPKTGGSSIEIYLSQKYNIPFNNSSLITHYDLQNCKEIFTDPHFCLLRNVSMQHFTYQNIYNHQHFFKVNFNNLTIISIVRNPYTRIISDLFHFNYITINSSKEIVFKMINQYLYNYFLDNHNLPQYLFLIDDDEKIIENLIILKTESLNEDMQKLGFQDFDLTLNTNENSGINYFDYLNQDSIQIINKYYEKDFEYFGYQMI